MSEIEELEEPANASNQTNIKQIYIVELPEKAIGVAHGLCEKSELVRFRLMSSLYFVSIGLLLTNWVNYSE